MDIWETLKIEFELDTFLINTEGFTFSNRDSKKANSSSKSNLNGFEYKALKYKQGSTTLTTLLVGKNSNGHYVYNNPNDSSDSGSVIDYLMRYKNMSWKDIADFAKNTNISIPQSSQINHQAKPKIELQDPVKIISVEDYKPNKYFAEERLIEDTILANPHILANVNFVRFNRNKKEFYGNAFAIKNSEDETTTFNMKSQYFKKGMFLGERKSGFWRALPEEAFSKFIIGEAAIDVISYYKYLNVSEPIAMISTEGRFSANYCNELFKIDKTIAEADITFVNDNDIHGFHFDLAWMQSLKNLPYTVGTKKIAEDETFIRIDSNQPLLDSELKDFKLSNGLVPFKNAVSLIKFIKHKFDLNKFSFHKSPYNDWNQKIQEDHTQPVNS